MRGDGTNARARERYDKYMKRIKEEVAKQEKEEDKKGGKRNQRISSGKDSSLKNHWIGEEF